MFSLFISFIQLAMAVNEDEAKLVSMETIVLPSPPQSNIFAANLLRMALESSPDEYRRMSEWEKSLYFDILKFVVDHAQLHEPSDRSIFDPFVDVAKSVVDTIIKTVQKIPVIDVMHGLCGPCKSVLGGTSDIKDFIMKNMTRSKDYKKVIDHCGTNALMIPCKAFLDGVREGLYTLFTDIGEMNPDHMCWKYGVCPDKPK